jgi:hypothetical protein
MTKINRTLDQTLSKLLEMQERALSGKTRIEDVPQSRHRDIDADWRGRVEDLAKR